MHVLFFNHWAKRGGSLFQGGSGEERGRERPSVRQFVGQKLSQTLTDLDETWQEWSFGQAGEIDTSAFPFGHQGAELLSAKGEKMGVLAVFGDF